MNQCPCCGSLATYKDKKTGTWRCFSSDADGKRVDDGCARGDDVGGGLAAGSETIAAKTPDKKPTVEQNFW